MGDSPFAARAPRGELLQAALRAIDFAADLCWVLRGVALKKCLAADPFSPTVYA